MSALAQICLRMGCQVSGSDLKESRNTSFLKDQGAQIFIGHDPKNVGPADVVVYSSAIPSTNCELEASKQNRITLLSRGEMLASLCEGKRTIAVAGTHGKTTTTSMISLAFENNGLDPTFVIGGELNDIGSSAKYGRGEFFIAETDESDGSFLHLTPEIAVITNIEADHLDYYSSLSEIESSFIKFIKGVKRESIICGDYANIASIISKNHRTYVSYGLKRHNHYCAENIVFDKFSASFDVYKERRKLGKVALGVPGAHNISNALGTLVLCLSLGLSFRSVSDALREFSGVKRRFEVIGSFSGITVVNDYAHHPTEVEALLSAAKAGGWTRVICFFQPHRFSRTKYLCNDFGAAFDLADVVILSDVYGAGEDPLPGISGKLIAEAILDRNPSKQLSYFPRIRDVESHLYSLLKEGDLLLFAGAGDIGALAGEFLNTLKKRHKSVSSLPTIEGRTDVKKSVRKNV